MLTRGFGLQMQPLKTIRAGTQSPLDDDNAAVDVDIVSLIEPQRPSAGARSWPRPALPKDRCAAVWVEGQLTGADYRA